MGSGAAGRPVGDVEAAIECERTALRHERALVDHGGGAGIGDHAADGECQAEAGTRTHGAVVDDGARRAIDGDALGAAGEQIDVKAADSSAGAATTIGDAPGGRRVAVDPNNWWR